MTPNATISASMPFTPTAAMRCRDSREKLMASLKNNDLQKYPVVDRNG